MCDKKEEMENKVKYLEFIEGVISRMASNSFAMKGWMLTIVAALLAIYADSNPKNPSYILIAIFPTVLFWFLDAYYLYIERKYRDLYKDVNDDNPTVKPFDLSTNSRGGFGKYLSSIFGSVSTSPLYGLIVIGLIIFYYIVK